MADSLIHRHPLQRLPSPSRGISALVHLVGLSSFFWAFKYMHENPNQANQAYGWHFQYLTVIGLTLSTLTFFVGLLADITLSRRLFLVKNILSICSAPLEVLISVLYWGLRSVRSRYQAHIVHANLASRSMSDWSFPNGLSFHFMPVRSSTRALCHYGANFVLDLSFHATPSIVMLIDLLFLSPPWTITVLPALMVSGTIAFGYWFWIEQCFAVNGWYPYPIFEALPTEGRIGLFTLSAIVMALSTITLKWLFGRVNGFGLPTGPESRPGDIRRKEGL
ncbi:unnamed protein product [Penicillium salamii]|nr:unnamed protein product [Penicillium salamii]CAG8358858.1 unnamed protein product [Penicillium salamii]